MSVTAAAITGAAALLGGAISHFSGKKRDKEQYERQKRDALQNWKMQNAYDSPAAQMARYKAAGLNPNLIYQQNASSNSIGSASSGYQAQDYTTAASNLIGSGLQEMSNVMLSERQIDANKALTDAQAEAQRIQNKYAMENILKDLGLKDAQIQSTLKNLGLLDIQMAKGQKEIDQIDSNIHATNMQLIMSYMDLQSRMDVNKATIANLAANTAKVKQEEQALILQNVVSRATTDKQIEMVSANFDLILETIEKYKAEILKMKVDSIGGAIFSIIDRLPKFEFKNKFMNELDKAIRDIMNDQKKKGLPGGRKRR